MLDLLESSLSSTRSSPIFRRSWRWAFIWFTSVWQTSPMFGRTLRVNIHCNLNIYANTAIYCSEAFVSVYCSSNPYPVPLLIQYSKTMSMLTLSRSLSTQRHLQTLREHTSLRRNLEVYWESDVHHRCVTVIPEVPFHH